MSTKQSLVISIPKLGNEEQSEPWFKLADLPKHKKIISTTQIASNGADLSMANIATERVIVTPKGITEALGNVLRP